MAVHAQQHKLNDAANHKGGTTPALAGELNVVGTSDAGGIGERTVEAYNSSPGAGAQEKIPVRGPGGHVLLPNGATGKQAINYEDAVVLNSRGPWSGVVCRTVTSEAARCDPTQQYSLGDKVIQLDASMGGKVYTVVSVAGGNTGDVVGWDYNEDELEYGWLPDRDVIYLDTDASCQMYYVKEEDRWYNLGSSGEIGPHRIDDGSKHYSNNNHYGILYMKAKSAENPEGQPAILRVTDNDGAVTVRKGSPLLASGSVAPEWGNLRLWPNRVAVADLQAPTECADWEGDTLGIVTNLGSFYLAFADASKVIRYVELTR